MSKFGIALMTAAAISLLSGCQAAKEKHPTQEELIRQMQQRMTDQLGLVLHIAPGNQGTQGLRGLDIQLVPIPGLCRKTRKALPEAVRRCMEHRPEIAHALLDEGSLFAGL